MKKWFALLLALTMMCMCMPAMADREDSAKFIEDYESLNGQLDRTGLYMNPEVNLPDYVPFEYEEFDDIVELLTEDTGVLYRDQVVILKGKLWYFNEYGFPVDAIVDLDGEKFFFKGTGGLKKGLVVFEGKTYYFDKTKEHMLTSQFVTVDNATYYFGADGAALTGTHVIDGVSYTFDADGKQV